MQTSELVTGAQVTGIEARRGLTQGRKRVAHYPQRIAQRLERGFDIDLVQRAPGGAALRQAVHRRAQAARRLLQHARRFLHAGQCAGHVLAFADRIARQLHQRPRTQALAEELRGEFRQLVRLVDHEGLRAGQDLAEAFLLEREVGQQQMMVDHHDVGGLRALPRLHHEALAPERAVGPEAVVGGGRHLRQQRRVFRQRVEFGHVAESGAPAPRHHPLELGDQLARGEAGIAFRLLHPVAAQVVRAPLQQRSPEAGAECVAHPRQIAEIQLILQGTGAGGNNRLHARQQRRHQIGEGLAGAGAGLGQQHAA